MPVEIQDLFNVDDEADNNFGYSLMTFNRKQEYDPEWDKCIKEVKIGTQMDMKEEYTGMIGGSLRV